MAKATMRKIVKNTGNQNAITFSQEETKCYKLKKGKIVKITLEPVEDSE